MLLDQEDMPGVKALVYRVLTAGSKVKDSREPKGRQILGRA
jgi:hypothetical protein